MSIILLPITIQLEQVFLAFTVLLSHEFENQPMCFVINTFQKPGHKDLCGKKFYRTHQKVTRSPIGWKSHIDINEKDISINTGSGKGKFFDLF